MVLSSHTSHTLNCTHPLSLTSTLTSTHLHSHTTMCNSRGISFNSFILCPIIMLVLSIYFIYSGVVAVTMNNAMNPKLNFQTHSDGCRIANVSDVEQIYVRYGNRRENYKQRCENLYTYSFALLEDTARKTFFSQEIFAGTQDYGPGDSTLCDSTDEPVRLPKFETNEIVDCWTPVETLSPDVLSFYCPKCIACAGDYTGDYTCTNGAGNNFRAQPCHSGTVPTAKECTTLLDPSKIVEQIPGAIIFFFIFGISFLLCTFCACFFVCGLQPNHEFQWPWSKSEKQKRAEREKRRERELDAI